MKAPNLRQKKKSLVKDTITTPRDKAIKELLKPRDWGIYKVINPLVPDGAPKTVKTIVREILILDPEARDDNTLLLAAYCVVKGADPDASASQLLDEMAAGNYGQVESVRRESKYLQRERPDLQGKNYVSNKIHDSSPTLFSLTAVPVLEEIANHLDRRLGGIWMDQEGVIWAKLLPCGNVYIHAGAIKERIKGVDEYKRAYVAIYRSDEKKRLTSKRTDSPRACYRVPLQDIDMHYRPRANDGTHEADGVGS